MGGGELPRRDLGGDASLLARLEGQGKRSTEGGRPDSLLVCGDGQQVSGDLRLGGRRLISGDNPPDWMETRLSQRCAQDAPFVRRRSRPAVKAIRGFPRGTLWPIGDAAAESLTEMILGPRK